MTPDSRIHKWLHNLATTAQRIPIEEHGRTLMMVTELVSQVEEIQHELPGLEEAYGQHVIMTTG